MVRQLWILLLPLALSGARTPETRARAAPTAQRFVVRMTDANRFEASPVTVAVGDTVEWVNVGKVPHTATDDVEKAGVPAHAVLPPGAEPWDSGLLSAGQRFSVVFRVPGEYTYLCTLHEALGMVGRVTVATRETGRRVL